MNISRYFPRKRKQTKTRYLNRGLVCDANRSFLTPVSLIYAGIKMCRVARIFSRPSLHGPQIDDVFMYDRIPLFPALKCTAPAALLSLSITLCEVSNINDKHQTPITHSSLAWKKFRVCSGASGFRYLSSVIVK